MKKSEPQKVGGRPELEKAVMKDNWGRGVRSINTGHANRAPPPLLEALSVKHSGYTKSYR